MHNIRHSPSRPVREQIESRNGSKISFRRASFARTLSHFAWEFSGALRGAWRNRSGIAATEFALLLPVLVVLFFGILELSEGMTANRRVAMAVNSAADLAAQSEQLSPSEIDGLMESVTAILEPSQSDAVDINLVSIILNADGDPVVHWSLHWNNDVQSTAPYQQGDDYTNLTDGFTDSPSGLIQLKNRSLIVVEMSYPYQAQFAKWFVNNPIQFDRTAMRAPRRAPRVQLCNESYTSCTS